MLQKLIQRNKGRIRQHCHKCIGFFREMDIVEMKKGHLFIHTTDMSKTEAITTYELFYVRTRQASFMRLVAREYRGLDHNDMRSYDRDTKLPIWSKVRIK